MKIFLLNCWNSLALGYVETYFFEVGAYVSLKEATAGVWESRFCWIYHEMSHFFKDKKTKEWDLKILLFNCWKDFALASVEKYIFEVGTYVSLKGATGGMWEGCFYRMWLEISRLFKYKNGGVGPKYFIIYLLKWSCLRLSRSISFGSQCIRASEDNHRRCLRGLFLMGLAGNITFFKYKNGGVGPKSFIV